MIPNLLIFLSEIQKLSLLYLAYNYEFRSPETLIFWWLIWGAVSTIILGKISDIKGRRFSFFITTLSALAVSLLSQNKSSFLFALLIDGLLVATLPIAFAAKNDLHPTKSKRLIYAEASFVRALPWCIVPLIYLELGFPSFFWEIAIWLSSILSIACVILFKDNQDHKNTIQNIEDQRNHSIFQVFVFVFLAAFFFAETSYQTVAYMVEEQENFLPLTKSYILFGLGMSFSSGCQLLIKEIKGLTFPKITEISFIIIFTYFLMKFISFSWESQEPSLSFTEKAILGIASGIYIPIIYAIVCEKFKIHQQGELCGLLESTMTLAEILSPGIAFFLINIKISSNYSLLIVGFGFFIAYAIIRAHRLLSRHA